MKVKTSYFSYGEEKESRLRLSSGQDFGPVRLAYESYGELSSAKDNAILLFHALTGNQHAAGENEEDSSAREYGSRAGLGWWDGFIGPGKALDTDQFFVICINYLGGCYGTTGPSSINPATGVPYGSSFPDVTISDMVDSQLALIKHLGIKRLHAVVGASVGGMLALNLSLRYPELAKHIMLLSCSAKLSAINLMSNFEQISAIERDPHFNGGDYYQGSFPGRGLGLARMIAHKYYLSLSALEERSRQEIVDRREESVRYRLQHSLESYMLHQGARIIERGFDANTYLLICSAMQRYNLTEDAGGETLEEAFARCRNQSFLVFSIDSDVCFYPEEQYEMVRLLKKAGVRVQYVTVHSDKGHDSFLLEPELYTPHIFFRLQEK